MSAPRAVPGSVDSNTESKAAALVGALRSEKSLLADLHRTLLRQRAAVAEDDIDGVEAGVRDVQRLLLTLNEAMMRRRSLIGLLTGSEDTDLGSLSGALPQPDREIEETAQQLIEVARLVAAELDTTRTLLSTAIASGGQYLRTMTGVEDTESLYRPAEEPRSQRQRALLVDQQA